MSNGKKGYVLEELLKAYFLKAGFFVMRGVDLNECGEVVTDIDLWIYERSKGNSRRVSIVDIKSKTKPKAIERLMWAKGLQKLLGVDGCIVATTDSRPVCHKIANKLDIRLLDGKDIKKLKDSKNILNNDRFSEEEIILRINKVDTIRHNKYLISIYNDLKTSIVDGLGAHGLVRCLDNFNDLGNLLMVLHKSSDASEIILRLIYFSTSLIALNLDYIGASYMFKDEKEKYNAIINAIRYGNVDIIEGTKDIRNAQALVSKFLDNGQIIASNLDSKITTAYKNIKSEIIADYVIKLRNNEDLFSLALRFELASFYKDAPIFDILKNEEKSLLGILLDFSNISREKFSGIYID